MTEHRTEGLAAYVAVLVVSLRLLSGGVASTAGQLVLTLAPMIPAAAMCLVIIRTLTDIDEFQRKLQFDALAMAFAGTALLTFSYGFLENIGYPRLSMFAVWPLMAGLWGLGLVLGHLRHR